MGYRSILVPIVSPQGAETALSAAIPLARQFQGTITALHVRFDPAAPLPYVAGPVPTEMLVELTDGQDHLAREKAAYLHNTVKARLDAAGVPWRWSEDMGNVDFRYGVAGRVHDLSVTVKPVPNNVDSQIEVLEGLLFYSGRPVLMVPEAVESFAPETILIAWSGSREASRAVAASMTFLRRAKRVIALTVGDVFDGPSGEDLRESLKAHDIDLEVAARSLDNSADGPVILSAVRDMGADLLVMGGYSHNRFRQLILGGVTKHVLGNATGPVLLAH